MRSTSSRAHHLIKARRGQITVVDRKGLEALSDGSYGVRKRNMRVWLVAGCANRKARCRGDR